MGLKFLNKKGWHTGSLRNIENVWKAEQKHDAEQKKLEELRKQIHEERERKEFRLLQEQAGLVPKQERLEFLYDSGLAVGNRSSEGFKALEPYPGADNEASAATGVSSSSKESSVPGALFEEKPQSANDAWRKLHSDPLLMIRQREQEAMARIKNNPVKMAMIRKSVEEKKQDGKNLDEKHGKAKSKHKRHSSSKHQSVSEDDRLEERERRRESKHKKKEHQDTDDESRGRSRHHRDSYRASEYDKQRRSNPGEERSRRIDRERSTRNNEMSKHERSCSYNRKDESTKETSIDSHQPNESRNESHKCRSRAPKLSEEERAARLREMQQDAELHEEQRWRRLKKADEDDARDAKHSTVSMGRSFLDAAHKSVYGAEKGGSSTIEESVRRRTHFLQGRSEADERNAFRR